MDIDILAMLGEGDDGEASPNVERQAVASIRSDSEDEEQADHANKSKPFVLSEADRNSKEHRAPTSPE